LLSHFLSLAQLSLAIGVVASAEPGLLMTAARRPPLSPASDNPTRIRAVALAMEARPTEEEL
jgi:hypothetical protein